MSTKQKIIQGSLFEDDYLVKSLGNIVRDAEYALTELVANAWDAGATKVNINVPTQQGGLIRVTERQTPDVEALPAAAGRELGGDVGKPLVARYIARKLTSKSPPVVPPSLKKIIEKAVAVTWKKSCLSAAKAVVVAAPVVVK